MATPASTRTCNRARASASSPRARSASSRARSASSRAFSASAWAFSASSRARRSASSMRCSSEPAGRSSHLLSRILSTVDQASVVASGIPLWAQTYASGRGRKVGSAPMTGTEIRSTARSRSNSASGNRPSISARRVDLPANPSSPRAAVRTSRRGRSRGATVIVRQRSDLDPVIGDALLDRLRARLGRDEPQVVDGLLGAPEPASDRPHEGTDRCDVRRTGWDADGEAFHVHSSPPDLSSRGARRSSRRCRTRDRGR